MSKKVRIVLDGAKRDFHVTGKTKKGVLKVHQNEGLFTSEYVEAVRKLRRYPRKGERLGENNRGLPCFVDENGYQVIK